MREKIYTKRQVLVASIIGGPVAGIYTLSKNIAAVDPTNNLLIFTMATWLPLSLFLLLAPYLPLPLSLCFVAAVCAGVYHLAGRRKIEKEMIKQARLFEYYQSSDVLGTSLRLLAVTLMTEFSWAAAISDYL